MSFFSNFIFVLDVLICCLKIFPLPFLMGSVLYLLTIYLSLNRINYIYLSLNEIKCQYIADSIQQNMSSKMQVNAKFPHPDPSLGITVLFDTSTLLKSMLFFFLHINIWDIYWNWKMYDNKNLLFYVIKIANAVQR